MKVVHCLERDRASDGSAQALDSDGGPPSDGGRLGSREMQGEPGAVRLPTGEPLGPCRLHTPNSVSDERPVPRIPTCAQSDRQTVDLSDGTRLQAIPRSHSG